MGGAWLGTEPITYAYQWQRCNATGEECASIEGATSATYNLAKADVGSTIRVSVTASNEPGNTSATSPQTETIGAPGPPANTEAPQLHGTAQQGQRLFASNGAWSGSRPLTFFYRWERCNSVGEACSAIEGATKPSYTLQSADVGSTLRLKVTASNSLGSAAVFSAITAVVASSSEASTNQAIELAQSADPSVIAKATSATLEEETVKPIVTDTAEALSSEATLASSSVSKETPGEFAVSTADGELSLAPIGTAPNAATTPTIVNGTAAVFAGTSPQTDTIVRPEPLGATTLLQLHSSQAPASFSWEVRIGAEQELQKLANGSVAIVEKESGSYLEGELPSEALEGAGKEASAETGEHGYGSEGASEEFGGSLEETTGQLEHLPAAPTSSTTPVTPKEGELHPQETQPQYESGSSAMSYAESHASGKTLMVIEAPTVMDAAGHTVPASLSIEGNTVTMALTPGKETTYPATAAIAVAAPSSKKAGPGPEAHRGLSDQQKSAFDASEKEGKPSKEFDPRLKSHMKIESARLIIGFDASPHSVLLREWLEAVHEAHIKPEKILVTFRACVPEAPNYGLGINARVPCPDEPSPTSPSFPGYYYNHVYALMKELIKDGVRTFGAWNEPNKFNEPLHPDAEAGRAALLWGEAQHAVERLGCAKHCIVVAGEFTGYFPIYTGKYVSAILGDAKRGNPTRTKPTYWGLHDYNDLERVQAESQSGKEVIAKDYTNAEADNYVRFIKSKRLGSTHIWLTEQGVKVETNTNETGTTRLTGHPELQRLAAQDFLRLGSSSMHVERLYYYQYKGPSKERKEQLAAHKPKGEREFASALLAGEGYGPEPKNWRPAFCVLVLGENGCPASSVTKAPVAGSITESAGTIVLDVSPEGLPTKYKVEYGASETYGQTTSSNTVANTEGAQSETVTLSGLQPCTTYHYQAEAENEGNEGKPALGGDNTFQTGGCVGTVISASSGGQTCAVQSHGGVDCWGYNEEGQLGNGTTVSSATPVEVNGITHAASVSTGSGFSCALLSGGSIDCWGYNAYGTLGNGTTTNSLTPVAVSGITNASGVGAARGQHACAVLSSGGVDCWGNNAHGELGNGTTESSTRPVAVSGITKATAVAAGEYSSCALLTTGGVDCWGWNLYGELGNGTGKDSSTPQAVSGIGSAVAISEGDVSACALLSSGAIDCWGYGGHGELGNGTTKEKPTPTAVSGITNASAISAGPASTCAVLTTGHADCWGDNENGSLGNGTTENSLTAVSVSNITNASGISAGGPGGCALLTGGGIDCWGGGTFGELGNGGQLEETSLTPVPVKNFP